MEIVKEAINTDQVVNIQVYNMKPVYYLKFFGGNIKVKTSNWKKKKLEERYYLYDVTDLVGLSEGFIYEDKSDYIDERFLKETGYASHIVECNMYDRLNGTRYNVIGYDTRIEKAMQLSKEYNNVEKIGIVCCERHIEADFNLIDDIKKFLKNNNKYTNNDKLLDNILIMQSEGDTYDFIVYAKPHVVFNMIDRTKKVEYFETIEDAETEYKYFAEDKIYTNFLSLK